MSSYGTYRTKTYIAGDWDGDANAIKKLYEWKNSDWYNLDFVDAHSITQARDSSLNCSIKRSLKERLDVSKTFVLVVGANTSSVRAGQCAYCSGYRSFYYSSPSCSHNYTIDNRSYIEYECEKAKEAGINIVVLYNYLTVDRSKCPESIRYVGTHLPMMYRGINGQIYWNYSSIKDAICG